MLVATKPPAIVGVPIAFSAKELEGFFLEEKRLPRGAGKKRRFSFVLHRRILAEKVLRTILDYHHYALALRPSQAEALFQRVEVRHFSLRRESRMPVGHYVIRVEYSIQRRVGWWSQSFHFVRDDTSILGGLSGKLYSSRRRFYAE